MKERRERRRRKGGEKKRKGGEEKEIMDEAFSKSFSQLHVQVKRLYKDLNEFEFLMRHIVTLRDGEL